MSEQEPENQDLTQVLNRINALMKHGEHSLPALDDEIPLLTRVYEGEPLTFTSHRPKTHAVQIESESETATATASEEIGLELIATSLTEELLNEMLPLIQQAVRTAVQQELANAEQTLASKIEADLVESLRQRLQS